MDAPDMPDLVRTFALREAGRAIYAVDARTRTGALDDVELVSMVRRGGSDTRTVFKRGNDDTYLYVTKAQMRERLRLILAGPAVLELSDLEPTTMVVSDFDRARVRP
jgi:hypothetical protein